MSEPLIQLDLPRWPGGPPICPQANLPAFPDEGQLGRHAGSSMTSVALKWKCVACGWWHAWTHEAADNNGGCRAGASRAAALQRLRKSVAGRTVPKEAWPDNSNNERQRQ